MRKRVLVLGLAVLVLIMAAPAMAGGKGAMHFTWGAGWQYGAPAAAVINKAGANVWWTALNGSTSYHDVYRAGPADGFSPYLVKKLNEPVRTLVINCLGYPSGDNDYIYFFREQIDQSEVPVFPNGHVLDDLSEVCN